MDAAQQTRMVWKIFASLPESDLNKLLVVAGVVPCKDRALRLHQALNIWFHNMIPSLQEIVNLSNEETK